MTPVRTRWIAAWAVLTVGFEFGLGRAVAGNSWEELLAAYDLSEGQLWPVVVASVAAGPEVTRLLRERATAGPRRATA